MKNLLLLITLICSSNFAQAQLEQFKNLDFSQIAEDSLTGKVYWQTKDFVEVSAAHQGDNNPCLKISGSYETNQPGYAYQEHMIEVADFVKVEVSAKIKAENVSDGVGDIYAYTKNGEQWLQYKSIEAVDGATGTTDWKSVSLEIWINPKADKLRIGASLNGKGSLLVDDFEMKTLEVGACPIDTSHLSFMNECMELIAEHSLYKTKIDTSELMSTWKELVTCAESIEDVHGSLGVILRSIDNHSFYMPVSNVNSWENTSADQKVEIPMSKGHRIDEHYAYIWMPHFSSGDPVTQILFADHLQGLIDSLDHENLKGWVFDLRDNQGGNCWPMLAGIGPILGEGVCGYFQYGEQANSWRYQEGGSYIDDMPQTQVLKPYKPYLENPPVAVLTGPRTGSSGEVVTAAFKNRPDTRSFGEKTGGYSTGNANYTLSDGSMLFLATSVYTDRDKNAFWDGISPDVEIADVKESEADEPYDKALEWLKEY